MFNEKRILIFTGGNLGPWALDEIRDGDFLVGVDRGALYLLRSNIKPDYVLGDFDSVTAEELAEIRMLCRDVSCCDPVDKDYTDTELAFNWALARKPEEIVLLGALGTRFDHSLANLHLLYKGLNEGIPCRIVDEKNEIILVDRRTVVQKGRFAHISLLPASMEVVGITLNGFQYPLNNATLRVGDSIGISNILTEKAGTVDIKSGSLLVIKSID